MANLLPLIEKRRIKREYRVRIGIVSLLLLSVLAIIAIVSLIPLHISSSFELNDIIKQMETEKQEIPHITEKQDPIKITQDVNEKLSVLRKKDSVLPLSSDLITVIVEHKPNDIKINALFYDKGLMDGKVSLNGIAKNRETLLSFLKSLEGEKIFTKVDLPISSFVEEKDIKFSIRITMEVKDIKSDEI